MAYVMLPRGTCLSALASVSLYDRVSQPEALGPPWGHGAVRQEPRSAAFTKQFCRDIAKPY